MSAFLANIINRHTNDSKSVTPRSRGIFEPDKNTPASIQSDELGQNFTEGSDTFSNRNQTEHSNEKHQTKKSSEHLFKYEKVSKRKQPLSFAKPSNAGMFGEIPVKNNRPDQSIHTSGETFENSPKSSFPDEASLNMERSRLLELLNANRQSAENQMDILNIRNLDKSANLSSEKNKATNAKFLNGVSLIQQRKDSLSDGLATENTPSIKINIGRIEIKAMNQQQEKIINKPAPQKPLLSLEQFLKQRNNK